MIRRTYGAGRWGALNLNSPLSLHLANSQRSKVDVSRIRGGKLEGTSEIKRMHAFRTRRECIYALTQTHRSPPCARFKLTTQLRRFVKFRSRPLLILAGAGNRLPCGCHRGFNDVVRRNLLLLSPLTWNGGIVGIRGTSSLQTSVSSNSRFIWPGLKGLISLWASERK